MDELSGEREERKSVCLLARDPVIVLLLQQQDASSGFYQS
jgi:hypothetical protein